MPTFSIEQLLVAEGRKAFTEWLAALIRADNHAEVDAVLGRLYAALPFELAALCRGLPAEAVSLTGWDRFNTRIEAISSRGEPVTAVGIDITDQGDPDEEGHREQLLETSYYTDASGFRFSAAGPAALLTASEGGKTAPWVGGFADIDDSLSVNGLAPLFTALLHKPELEWSYMRTEAERRENVASFLAGWVRHLRVHQAVRRALGENGLARAIPVIVGTNEVSPYFTAVYHPARLRDYQAAARESEAAGVTAHRQARAKVREDQIAQWREQRDDIRDWSPRVNPDKRRTYIEYVEALERLFRAGTPLTALPPAHSLSDAEFEHMIQVYRHHRDPSTPVPPPSP